MALLIRRWPRAVAAASALAAICLATTLLFPDCYESTVVLESHGPLRAAVQIEPAETPGYLVLHAWGPERQAAQRNAMVALDGVVHANPSGAVFIIDPPSLPMKPTGIDPYLRALAALLFGLASVVITIPWLRLGNRLGLCHA